MVSCDCSLCMYPEMMADLVDFHNMITYTIVAASAGFLLWTHTDILCSFFRVHWQLSSSKCLFFTTSNCILVYRHTYWHISIMSAALVTASPTYSFQAGWVCFPVTCRPRSAIPHRWLPWCHQCLPTVIFALLTPEPVSFPEQTLSSGQKFLNLWSKNMEQFAVWIQTARLKFCCV